MIHKKWHFQLFGLIKISQREMCEVLMFDSQTAPNPKLNEGFNSQLYAVREAKEYIRIIETNPTKNQNFQGCRVFCFECMWSDLPGDFELKNTLEVINALSVGKPKIIYPNG